MAEKKSEKLEFIEERTVRTGAGLNDSVVLPEIDAQMREEFPDEAETALVGTVFAGQFEVAEIIGKGGMSVVYRAKDQLLRQEVAIKTLHTNLSYDQNSYRRFQQEAATALSLDHQNIVRVRTFGIQNALPYMVMDLLEGKSLSDLIKGKAERIPIPVVLHIFSQTCSGLNHAHAKGIVHRDIKPSNVMLVDYESDPYFVKVLDFGIAKLLPQDGEIASRLTQTGEIFGSPLYMCPEQWSGKAVDARSDIYSLGCVLYEALNGKPPHYSPNVFDTMHQHLMEIPAPLDIPGCDPALLERLETVTFKALEKNPDKRYQTMGDFKRDLDSIAADLAAGKLGRSLSAGISRTGRSLRRAAVKVSPWTIALTVCGAMCIMLLASLAWVDVGWFLKESDSMPAELHWTPSLSKLIDRLNHPVADTEQAKNILGNSRLTIEIRTMQNSYTQDELEAWKKRSLVALNSGSIEELVESRDGVLKCTESLEQGMSPPTADAEVEFAEALIIEGTGYERGERGRDALRPSIPKAAGLLEDVKQYSDACEFYSGNYAKLLLGDIFYTKAQRFENEIHKLYFADKKPQNTSMPEDTHGRLEHLFQQVDNNIREAQHLYASIENLKVFNTRNKEVPFVRGVVQAKIADTYRWKAINSRLHKPGAPSKEAKEAVQKALKHYANALTLFKEEGDKEDAAKASYYLGYLAQMDDDYNGARMAYAGSINELDTIMKANPDDRQLILSDYARVLWKGWDFIKAMEIRDQAFKTSAPQTRKI
ncbi:MAG: protein kinase [Candidatus Obscuribacterales bacterium]|nr:protein kinase [Candidatus Obscuribacterales bacterium]